MLQELAARTGAATWAIASMLFFLAVWLVIAVRVMRARPEELEARARLALEGEDETPGLKGPGLQGPKGPTFRGPLTRITGPLTRSTGPLTRSTGPLTRITGPLTRSTGPLTRITGPLTRSTGPFRAGDTQD